MSHATYCLLLSLDDPSASDKDLKSEAKSTIEAWAEHHFDENNWYQEKILILKNNHMVQLADKDDWRGRDGTFKHVEDTVPEASRFAWAHRHALDCVANSLGVFNLQQLGIGDPTNDEKTARDKYVTLSFDDIVAKIHELAPRKLSELYAKISGPRTDDDWMPDYERSCLSEGYELFRDTHTCPFSRGGTPYRYRAFDLTHGETLDNDSGIVLVDIHT